MATREECVLAVALAQIVLGEEHALVCQAASHYADGCTDAEIVAATRLEVYRVKFILWDLHNNGLGTYRAPIFVVTPEYLLEEAVEGIPCAEKRGRFNCALQRSTVGVTSKGIATNPMEE